MTNRDKFNKEIIKKSNAEIGNIIRYDPCDYCAYDKHTCAGKSCDEGVKEWLDMPCADETSSADNEDKPQEAIGTGWQEAMRDIVKECKDNYPNDCEDCRYGDTIGICTFFKPPVKWGSPQEQELPPDVKTDLKNVVEGLDIVNKPSHYVKDDMECIDFIKAIVTDLTPYEAYCVGNVVKYLWRFKDKNGVIDLDNAVRYIEFLKEVQDGQNG